MRLRLAAVLLVLALAAAACVNSNSGPGTVSGAVSSGPTTTAGFTLPKGTYIVPCSAAASGEPAPGFLPQSVRFGPVVFVGALADRGTAKDFKPVAPGRYAPTRTTVVVTKGKSAVVQVPKHERANLSLLFDHSRIHQGQKEPVSYGVPAVLFQKCPATAAASWLQYPGAVIVAGARCAKLTVIPLKPGTHQPSGKRSRVKIPYGRKSCTAHS